jgi:serpin B
MVHVTLTMRTTLKLSLIICTLITASLTVGCGSTQQKYSPPRHAPQQLTTTANSNTQFAFEIYQKVAAGNDNLVFSPASISQALAMTYAGAHGETKKEIGSALHFQESADFHSHMSDLPRHWINNNPTKGPEISIANRLFVEKTFQVLPTFLSVTSQHYESPPTRMDFINDSNSSRKSINSWVSDQTHGRIDNLLTKGKVDSSSRMIIVNAVYFKGKWEHTFEKSMTSSQPFYINEFEQITTPTMHSERQFQYTENDQMQAIALPYQHSNMGNDMSMIVILPKKKTGLNNLETSLSQSNFAATLSGMKMATVNLWLPKFKFSKPSNLNDPLRSLGIKLAFTDNADFSRISSTKLSLSNVIHQAQIEVDELGSVASASTAVVATATSVMVNPPPEFRADHPFVFAIFDHTTQSLLFLGKVSNPTKN